MIVKICGVTRPEDAAMCARAGADWIGLNFWPRSKRFLDRRRAPEVAAAAREQRPDVTLVGVFVDAAPADIAPVIDEVPLDRVQLHGDEPASAVRAFGARAIKAARLAGPGDADALATIPCEIVLVDAPTPGYGGSGRVADWTLARRAVATGKSIVLAGGLGPENVGEAIRRVRPFGVDVASGVESAPGEKDAERVRAFVEAARG